MDIKQTLTSKWEGLELKMYLDSKGIPTIGRGHNLRDVPITQRAADVIFEDDCDTHWQSLVQGIPWVRGLDSARQAAMFDLAYNMGIQTLLTFHQFLNYMKSGQYDTAAQDLLQTPYASQVGKRALGNAELIAHGEASPLWRTACSQATLESTPVGTQ